MATHSDHSNHRQADGMTLKLKVWRQKDGKAKGHLVDYKVSGISPDMSFLEMLDTLNNQLIAKGEDPVAFDHDCREGICGSCGVVINGNPHGPDRGTATCQLHMRTFNDGDEIVVEPWRARAFKIVKDLYTDRSALDRIIASGGYVSVNTGSAPEAHASPINKENAELAFDAAACIGCGACVAACKNASAALFTSAKISHLQLLPQGAVEGDQRALRMVQQMDKEGFGSCSLTEACEAACPKEIKVENIVRMNRLYAWASLRKR
jgi:succinate dehydrogenase / fumarate reductase iron-sulfur subunit